MNLRYPSAQWAPLPAQGGYVSGPYRGVLHSTEGSSFAGAMAAYKKTGNYPHFTASYETGAFRIWQHLNLDRFATALAHPSGTIDTNRLSAIQLEVVGFAAQAHLWPTALLDGIRDWMRWIEGETTIRPRAPAFLPYPDSAGANAVRMTATAWKAFDGWCGHMHVVANDHGDPGLIDISYLLQRAVTPVTAPVGVPVHDFQEAAVKSALLNIGPLDDSGNGWFDYDPALGRDPIVVGVTLLGPSPPDDKPPYWPQQAHVNLAAQPRGGKLRVVVRGGTAGDTVGVWVAVA